MNTIMNTIMYQTIRAGVVLGVTFFAFAGDVFAAPILTPVTAIQVTGDGATLIGHVSNPNKTSTVWFEVNDGFSSSVSTTVGMNAVYHEGFFQGYLTNLTPGVTYYYRAAAMEGGVTVYSPVSPLRTIVPVAVSSAVATFPVASRSDYPANTTRASVAGTQTQTISQTKKSTTGTVAKKITTTNSSNNTNNTAMAIGAGNGMFPSTLIGWITLIILLLAVVLLGHMIYGQGEERKKKLLPHEIEKAGVVA